MALQTSGSISISDLVSEFGGSAPHSLSEYFRGGANVPTTITTGVPQGSFTAYQNNTTGLGTTGTVTSVNYFWKVQLFSSSAVWNGVTKPNTNPDEAGVGLTGPADQTLFLSNDGFEYQRGSFIGVFTFPVSGIAFSANLYQVRRRQAATETSTTVNTGIPSSGQVSLTDYYGGRKT